MKKWIALLLALVMLMSLVACGKPAEELPEEPETVTEPVREPVEEETPEESANLVGVAMPTKDLQRWNQDGENMKLQLFSITPARCIRINHGAEQSMRWKFLHQCVHPPSLVRNHVRA